MGVAFFPNAKIRLARYSGGSSFEARSFFDVENASACALSFEEEEKSLADYRSGTGGVDASIKRVTGANGNMDLRHFTPENLATIFWGTTATLAATAIVGESGGKVGAVGKFTPTKRLINTSIAPVIKKGATTILAADYTVSPGGITWKTITTGGVAPGDAITIDYTPLAGASVEALISSAPDVSIHLEGINQVDGNYWIVRIYKAKLGVASNVPFIAADFAAAGVSFTAQKDETVLSGSQYFSAEFAS
jgi:hypothetical protein